MAKKTKKKIDMKAEREKMGLTREEVADRLGVTYRTVDAWENNRRNPSQQVIMLIEDGALDDEFDE